MRNIQKLSINTLLFRSEANQNFSPILLSRDSLDQGFYTLSGRTTYRKISDREIRVSNSSIALKFDRRLGSTTAELPVKF